MDDRATPSDNLAAVQRVPDENAPEESWLAWADGYSTLTASGLVCTGIRAGSAEFRVDEPRFPLNPNGAANGGIVALLADQAMGVCAIRCTPAGRQPVTIVLETHFHRPAFPPLTLTAALITSGRSISTVQVVVLDKDGKQCASATGTMAATPTPGSRE